MISDTVKCKEKPCGEFGEEWSGGADRRAKAGG